jgi:DNA-directed RNA polymerase subunit RPC12/RpoP
MQDEDGMDIACPRCGGTDISEDSVVVRVMPPAKSLAASMLQTNKYEEHKNVPIIRCEDCGNVAFSEKTLAGLIPELNDPEIKDVEFVKLPERFHELN